MELLLAMRIQIAKKAGIQPALIECKLQVNGQGHALTQAQRIHDLPAQGKDDRAGNAEVGEEHFAERFRLFLLIDPHTDAHVAQAQPLQPGGDVTCCLQGNQRRANGHDGVPHRLSQPIAIPR